jgi:hypothetical protein
MFAMTRNPLSDCQNKPLQLARLWHDVAGDQLPLLKERDQQKPRDPALRAVAS